MLRLDITIQHASKIPLLGVKTEPSPYMSFNYNAVSWSANRLISLAPLQGTPKTQYGTTTLSSKPRRPRLTYTFMY